VLTGDYGVEDISLQACEADSLTKSLFWSAVGSRVVLFYILQMDRGDFMMTTP